MPAFDSPEPISVSISIGAGRIRITAADRADTTVEVRPSDDLNPADVQAAAESTVEYASGHLLVKAPRFKAMSLFGLGGSVEVEVGLPAGSRVSAEAAGDIRAEGRLAESSFKTTYGDLWVEETGRVRLYNAHGDITVTRAAGHADVTSANGQVRIRAVGGGVVKSSNGHITLGEVTGPLRLKTAYGDIGVDRVLADLEATTSTGGITVAEAVRGSIVLETGYGDIEVGVRRGTAAWLDATAVYGNVRTSLDAADVPHDAEETVEVRARTSYGEIFVRHS
ncbi:DUF4097 family beta strand repeat-containing protein [Spongiactinospora sp. TRM90649]|uniref:DUF4097 family beta strand repeat-containing protein n=1 Tax=Spongiactinospora sp. TRM90649 TaxID=3031114 RepID=UPI0023F6AC0E|nr:DUF4097 family beta strand repeat-containing protein [Spongiactinospora sp. TRM90649]MDF5758055.1 DUF4097 family beta strand repeat-containing protein [Spongiactinospora sp. TRM90649]